MNVKNNLRGVSNAVRTFKNNAKLVDENGDLTAGASIIGGLVFVTLVLIAGGIELGTLF